MEIISLDRVYCDFKTLVDTKKVTKHNFNIISDKYCVMGHLIPIYDKLYNSDWVTDIRWDIYLEIFGHHYIHNVFKPNAKNPKYWLNKIKSAILKYGTW